MRRTDRYEYRIIGQSQGESLLCTLLMAVITFTFIGLTTYLVTRPDERKLNILAPLYVFPYPWVVSQHIIAPEWLALEKSAIDNPDVQQVVVLNPANGAGALWDPNGDPGTAAGQLGNYVGWTKVIDKLKVLKNVKLVGYVYTKQGDSAQRNPVDVKAEIDGYFENWSVEGIFFDETTS